jgi:hypothetical protein
MYDDVRDADEYEEQRHEERALGQAAHGVQRLYCWPGRDRRTREQAGYRHQELEYAHQCGDD